MSTINKSFIRMLKGIVILDLEFESKTGLLIRMPIQAQAYRIGGGDVYPMVTKRLYVSIGEVLEIPYIPGSSFKGRMRGLLELTLGKKLYTTDQKIWQHVRSLSAMSIDEFVADVLDRCVIDELFGYAATNYRQILEKAEKEKKSINVDDMFKVLAITRLLVDDFYPSEEYVKKIGAKSIADFLEEKSENRLDRVTSAADPRDVVRVKPGTIFGGKVTLLLFDHDDAMIEKYLATVATGLKLIEETYLGGSGSRGYGRVKFTKIDVGVDKVQIINGVPKLISLINLRKRYNSVEELEKNIAELVQVIKNAIFG